jgi:hypothetical protein
MPETCLLSSSRRRLLLVQGLFSLHQGLWVILLVELAVVVGDRKDLCSKPKMLIGDYLVLVDINIVTLVGYVLLLFNTLVGKLRYHVEMMFLRISANFILIRDLHVAMPLAVVQRRTQPLPLSCHG